MTPEFEKLMSLVEDTNVRVFQSDLSTYMIGDHLILNVFYRRIHDLKSDAYIDVRFKGNFVCDLSVDDSRVILNAIKTRQITSPLKEFLAYNPTKE